MLDMPEGPKSSSVALAFAHLPSPFSLLAFDFGLKRIGVAVGQSVTRTAKAIAVLEVVSKQERLAAIGPLINAWQPDILVVGQPFHPDGQPHEMTHLSARFGRQMSEHFRLPMRLVDERYTSVEASRIGYPEQQIDAIAAQLIAEQFFNEQLTYERGTTLPTTP